MSVYPLVDEKDIGLSAAFRVVKRIVFSSHCLTFLVPRMRKDKLKHCRSIKQMHLSTYRFHYHCWMQITKKCYQNILRYVGKGWFSRVECRVRNWPFWSHCIFMIRWRWTDGVEASLQCPRVISSAPNHEMRFPDCQSVGAVQEL
jgi:hypothetical protein